MKCGRVITSNKSQAASLESIMLGGAKRVLGCSSKTSNEAIWGDMGMEFLQGRRDKRKLSWWYKVVNMSLSRYPKQLFQEEWNIKPRPGRQRKVWKRVVDDIFESLELDKQQQLDKQQHLNISLCIGYTIYLYIAYIRPQPLGCLGSSVVRAPV